jgi:hypothetical protein
MSPGLRKAFLMPWFGSDYMCAIMASPKTEHLISVAPSISRAKS